MCGASTSHATAMTMPGTACGSMASALSGPLPRIRVRVTSTAMPSPRSPQMTAASTASITELVAPWMEFAEVTAFTTLSSVRFSGRSASPGARSSDCCRSASSGSTVTVRTSTQVTMEADTRPRPSGRSCGAEEDESSSQRLLPMRKSMTSAASASTSRTTPMVATTASGSSTVPDCR